MHFMLFAAQRYIEARGTISQLSDLADHRLLDLALDIAGQGNLAAWTKLSFHNALLTNVNGALCETVRHGGGIGLLPTFAKLFEPSLVPVQPNFRLPAPLYVCYDRENAKRPAVRSVLDYLRNMVFNQQEMPWLRDPCEAPDESWPGIYAKALAELYPNLSRAKAANGKAGKPKAKKILSAAEQHISQ